jgi:hypothetical protein
MKNLFQKLMPAFHGSCFLLPANQMYKEEKKPKAS